MTTPDVGRNTGVELKGKIILLDFVGQYPDEEEDAPALDASRFYFLSTNSATAQGENGDFYFDEYGWVHGFGMLNKVAIALATHTIYKRTYFSTPSTKTHESYWPTTGSPGAQDRIFGRDQDGAGGHPRYRRRDDRTCWIVW